MASNYLTDRFYVRASGSNLDHVDQRLVAILSEAANHLPDGYRVQINDSFTKSGHAPQSQHKISGKGAIDVQIVGPQGPIKNSGPDATGLYKQLAQNAYGVMKANYPELDGKLAWGGSFGKGRNARNVADLMHFDIGGERGTLAPHLSKMGAIKGQNYTGHPVPSEDIPGAVAAGQASRTLRLTGTPGKGRMSGPEVEALGKKLSALGYDVGKPADTFGPKMQAAVRSYQAANGLKPDGIVGPKTSAKLNPAAPAYSPGGSDASALAAMSAPAYSPGGGIMSPSTDPGDTALESAMGPSTMPWDVASAPADQMGYPGAGQPPIGMTGSAEATLGLPGRPGPGEASHWAEMAPAAETAPATPMPGVALNGSAEGILGRPVGTLPGAPGSHWEPMTSAAEPPDIIDRLGDDVSINDFLSTFGFGPPPPAMAAPEQRRPVYPTPRTEPIAPVVPGPQSGLGGMPQMASAAVNSGFDPGAFAALAAKPLDPRMVDVIEGMPKPMSAPPMGFADTGFMTAAQPIPQDVSSTLDDPTEYNALPAPFYDTQQFFTPEFAPKDYNNPSYQKMWKQEERSFPPSVSADPGFMPSQGLQSSLMPSFGSIGAIPQDDQRTMYANGQRDLPASDYGALPSRFNEQGYQPFPSQGQPSMYASAGNANDPRSPSVNDMPLGRKGDFLGSPAMQTDFGMPSASASEFDPGGAKLPAAGDQAPSYMYGAGDTALGANIGNGVSSLFSPAGLGATPMGLPAPPPPVTNDQGRSLLSPTGHTSNEGLGSLGSGGGSMNAFGSWGTPYYGAASLGYAANPNGGFTMPGGGYSNSPFTPSGYGWNAPDFDQGSGGPTYSYQPNGYGGGSYIDSHGNVRSY